MLLIVIGVVLLVFILLIVIINGNKTMVCTHKSNQSKNGYMLETKNVVKYKGDYVVKVNTTEIITSNDKEVLNKFEDSFKKTDLYNKDTYGGYTYNITNKNGKVVNNIVIDYRKFDMKKFLKNNVAMEKYVKDGKLTVDGEKKYYKATGAKCN